MTSTPLMFKYHQRAKLDLTDGLEGKKQCRFCGAERQYITQDIGIGFPKGYPIECECINELYKEAQHQERIEREANSYIRRIDAAQIPRRYQGAKTNRAVGSWYFYGNAGTGKTYEACAVLMEAIDKGMTALFVTMSRLCGFSFQEREEAFEQMRRVDVLCIDDLGKAETNEWANALAFQAIDERYNTGKNLVITSNYALNALAARLESHSNEQTAQATISRIAEQCKRVEMTGKDRRL